MQWPRPTEKSIAKLVGRPNLTTPRSLSESSIQMWGAVRKGTPGPLCTTYESFFSLFIRVRPVRSQGLEMFDISGDLVEWRTMVSRSVRSLFTVQCINGMLSKWQHTS